jgi:HTH-type transcriptional regulator/antitoxin HigA
MAAHREHPKGMNSRFLQSSFRATGEHYPVGAAKPVAAIRFAMDQGGLKPKDLIPYLGPAPRVSEV